VAQWRALRLKASSFSEHAIATLSQKAKKSNKAEPNPKETNKAKKKKKKKSAERVWGLSVGFVFKEAVRRGEVR
jgi:hypothetical protein